MVNEEFKKSLTLVMDDNSKLLLTITIVAVIVYIFYTLLSGCQKDRDETFWGGYFPVPYMGQPVTKYGRSGINSATDKPPQLLVNLDACNINPYYCKHCGEYRCCWQQEKVI